MKYDLLLLDVDGTTVASKGDALPSLAVAEAVQQAQAAGVHVALATGRTVRDAQKVVDALKLKGLSVFNGGAEIIDVESGQVMQSQYLSVRAAREVVRLALPFGYNLYNDTDQYAQTLTGPEEIIAPTAKLFIESVPSKAAPAILEQLSAVLGAEAHPTTSWSDGDVVDIHITHEHANKRHGVERLITMLGLSKDRVIAVGDSYNDMPMLEAAGFKAVMGDAPDQVKSTADYVAPTLAEDGVADVINRFIL